MAIYPGKLTTGSLAAKTVHLHFFSSPSSFNNNAMGEGIERPERNSRTLIFFFTV